MLPRREKAGNMVKPSSAIRDEKRAAVTSRAALMRRAAVTSRAAVTRSREKSRRD